MARGLSNSPWGNTQLSILGHVAKELEDIESETPNTLELILKQKHSGVSDLEVGARIVKFFTKY